MSNITIYYFRFFLLFICTLKMFAFIPFVLSRLWLTLRDPSLAGSIGSLTSLFSASVSSSSWASFEKAPSSISEIRLPVRSILLSVAVKQHNMDVSFPLGCNWKCFLLTLSSFTNYHAIPNLFDFISSVEHRKYSSLFCPCTHKNKCFKGCFFFGRNAIEEPIGVKKNK